MFYDELEKLEKHIYQMRELPNHRRARLKNRDLMGERANAKGRTIDRADRYSGNAAEVRDSRAWPVGKRLGKVYREAK